MNISIPDELKARMDAHGDGVNWSRVAAEAFEKRLNSERTQSMRELASSIDDAAAASDDPLGALLGIVREARPDLVAPLAEDLGPVYRRALDREDLRDAFRDWTCDVPWPLESPDEMVAVVRNIVFGYHERVVEPLLAKVLGEVVFLRMSLIADKLPPSTSK
jgi:hypothetical protein